MRHIPAGIAHAPARFLISFANGFDEGIYFLLLLIGEYMMRFLLAASGVALIYIHHLKQTLPGFDLPGAPRNESNFSSALRHHS